MTSGSSPAREPFWQVPAADLLTRLGSGSAGLTDAEAESRRARMGANVLAPDRSSGELSLLLAQFKSPIVLLLVAAAVLSLFLHDPTDAAMILVIVLLSGLLSWWQERGAADAVAKLLALVQTVITVRRGGQERALPVADVVAGDILLLSAGSTIPADCALLDSKDLFVDEAALTGETYPVVKRAGTVAADEPLARRSNVLFAGTHVVSGTATAVVVCTGRDTEFGRVAERLRLRSPETEFERGVRRFGYLIMEVTFVLVVLVFALNVYFERPVFDSLLFSLALAVGLTPQMLPAIISITLAQGARRMAAHRVIVRRLSSIENFGSMDVLCTDKTGTVTEGAVRVHSAINAGGGESEQVLRCAFLNASYQSGFVNPIDEAIRHHRQFDLTGYEKRDELPYDFVRKRLSVLVAHGDERLLITKGAVVSVLDVCSQVELTPGSAADLASNRVAILGRYESLSSDGLRTLAVATRRILGRDSVSKDDESEMTLLGFVTLHDPPKAGIVNTLARLRNLGIAVKMITGDNRLVATAVGRQIGLSAPVVLTGPEVHTLSDEALRRRVLDVDLFAEVEPNQKERVILALKKAGRVVGFMGDGINDASALHAADVGISVEGAVDVAQEAADLVLLERDLNALEAGVRQGRSTFANTLKYVHMATSANFGNMFSMAGASLLLPFLPLLPKQILLVNLLTDFPAMSIGTDAVDDELIDQPRRWDVSFIRRFMIVFGLLSSLFDYVTFGVLLLLLHADADQFRTGWFVESVASASLVVLVIRTRRPLIRSRPSGYLALATGLVVVTAALLPYLPVAPLLDFERLAPTFLVACGVIVTLYLSAAELAKRIFYRRT